MEIFHSPQILPMYPHLRLRSIDRDMHNAPSRLELVRYQAWLPVGSFGLSYLAGLGGYLLVHVISGAQERAALGRNIIDSQWSLCRAGRKKTYKDHMSLQIYAQRLSQRVPQNFHIPKVPASKMDFGTRHLKYWVSGRYVDA